MAETFANEISGVDAVPSTKSNGGLQGGRLRRFRASVTLAEQAIADTIVLADVPAGYAFSHGVLNTSASLGSSTLAIGNATTAGKFRAAAVFTTTNSPTFFGVNAAVAADPPEATERVIATVAAAALPASGTLVVDLYFSAP